ncbi:strigolactone esterase D14-like [Coffea eugenioides]|uniref:strigolactone esterase D14-like n=1 Tax=Coffea eugenioides TaxID=49369 RepID=UPI000F6138F2|nr:strigolactone esterase D14-like [Coffea eugenioides]
MDELSKCGSGILEALNTRVYGNATNTLVLSHGFGVDQTVWQFIIPVLACYFKVVVYDLVFSPNVSPKLYDPKRYSHNFSAYAEDLICILDQLHVKETVFIGHSMSAMIGCIAATKRPQLFQHLILLNGSPRYLDAQHYEGGFREQDLNAILTNLQRNFSAWAHDLAPSAIGVNNSEAIAKFEGTLAKMKPEIALDVAKTVFLGDNRHFLQHVRMRSTIIQPEKDIFVPLSVPRYMKKKLHAQLIILGISGHFPQLTAYALLLRVIKNLLILNSN